MSEVIDKDKQQIIDNIQKHINNNKRKLEDHNNNSNSGNSNNHNNNNNSNKSNNKNKNNNNNKNNKKQKLRYTHNYNYKLISPFQKYIEFGICPTLSDLYTEFYHILNENNQDCKCVKLGKELDELNKLSKSGQSLPPNFQFNVRHQHTALEIDSIEFNSSATTNRETIELAVRKFCGFLQKESNMVLMEMILLSIGLSKSIEFLHFTLEIERDGGIFTTVTPKSTTTTSTAAANDSGDSMKIATEDNDISTTTTTTTTDTTTTTTTNSSSTAEPIVRRRTPGGVFYKLINLHLPVGNKTNLFSLSALHKYRGQRRKNGFGVLENLSGRLLDFGGGNASNNSNSANSSNDENNSNSKHLNTLLKEVDEEFDKLCISNNNNNNNELAVK